MNIVSSCNCVVTFGENGCLLGLPCGLYAPVSICNFVCFFPGYLGQCFGFDCAILSDHCLTTFSLNAMYLLYSFTAWKILGPC